MISSWKIKWNHPIYKEEREQMKKITGFKKGYYIKIIDGFYEVIDGNRVVHFGQCKKNSTIQEIANKTILLNQEGENDGKRIKDNVRPGREKRYRTRNKNCATEDVVSV